MYRQGIFYRLKRNRKWERLSTIFFAKTNSQEFCQAMQIFNSYYVYGWNYLAVDSNYHRVQINQEAIIEVGNKITDLIW